MKISLIQMNSTNNTELNIEKALGFIGQCGSSGSNLVSLPETFHWLGPEHEKPAHSVPVPGDLTEMLSNSAKKHKMYIHAGSILEKREGMEKCSNTTLFFLPDGKIGTLYRKIHLFDAEIGGVRYCESDVIEGGENPVTIEHDNTVFGLSICYDLRFPELYRSLSFQGAQIIFSPAAFTVPTGEAHWETLIRARAIENQVFMAAAAQVGKDSAGKTYYGHSMIAGPWGQILGQMDGSEEGILTAEIDLARIDEVRRNLPAHKHKRL
jgi:predicted amidohydrolase